MQDKIIKVLIIISWLICVLSGCGKSDREDKYIEEKMSTERVEKGYELSIEDSEREEAETDCKRVAGLVFDIYKSADKGDSDSTIFPDKVIFEMQDKISDTGFPVSTDIIYSDMKNYELMEKFFNECVNGKITSVVRYEIHFDGGIGRSKYIFDGKDMYVLNTNIMWDSDNCPKVVYMSHNRIKEWKYTDKGWFCYKLCVPEPPEVTEIVDGSQLIRVKPMSEENREISERILSRLSYCGSNILCSDWDKEHMENLDFNGMYEYFYEMKYNKKFNYYEYVDGIPKEEFENLIMEYLLVDKDKIQEYAVFDDEKQTYIYERLGCLNYTPTYFGTSIPEVTEIKQNQDGTVTLTVDAVCDMVLCNDAVITHELTVQFTEDGGFKYLGNKILNDGIDNIPEYQYRIKPH